MSKSKIGFEGGTLNATITTSNQGATDSPLTFINIGTGGGLTYDATHAAHGSQAAKVAPASGQVVTMQYGSGSSSLASTTLAARFYIYQTANVTAQTLILDLQDTAGAHIGRVYLDATNKLQVRDGGASILYTATSALALNQWNRVELWAIPGSTTLHFAYYTGDSTTAVATYDNTTATTGSNAVAQAIVGRLFNTTDTTAFWIDDFAVETAASAFIGPEVNQPPTASISANQTVAASASVTVSVTASDPDGTIASYAWTGTRYTTTAAPASISPSSGAGTASIAYTASSATTGALEVWSCTVTDNQGATTTVATEVRVPTSGEILPLRGFAGVGTTVTVAGGAASAGEALSDSSDTTYVEYPSATGSEQPYRFRLAPSTARSGLNLTNRLMQDVSGTLTCKARLYQASDSAGASVSLIQEWTFSSLTTSAADYTGSVSSLTGITDWGNLWLADVEI